MWHIVINIIIFLLILNILFSLLLSLLYFYPTLLASIHLSSLVQQLRDFIKVVDSQCVIKKQRTSSFPVLMMMICLLSAMASAYLAADRQLSSEEGRHRLHSADLRALGTDVSRLPAQSCGTAFHLVLRRDSLVVGVLD